MSTDAQFSTQKNYGHATWPSPPDLTAPVSIALLFAVICLNQFKRKYQHCHFHQRRANVHLSFVKNGLRCHRNICLRRINTFWGFTLHNSKLLAIVVKLIQQNAEVLLWVNGVLLMSFVVGLLWPAVARRWRTRYVQRPWWRAMANGSVNKKNKDTSHLLP